MENSEILTVRKGLLSSCAVFKGFNDIIFDMGNPEKTPSITSSDGSRGIEDKLRAAELSAYSIGQLRGMAKEYGLGRTPDASLVATILKHELKFRTPEVVVEEVPQEDMAALEDHERIEPPVDTKAEDALLIQDLQAGIKERLDNPGMAEVTGPVKGETPHEIYARVAPVVEAKIDARLKKADEIAEGISKGEYPKSPADRQFMMDNAPDINHLLEKKKEGQTKIKGGRVATENPFPAPRVPEVKPKVEAPVAKEAIASPEVKGVKVEEKAPVSPAPEKKSEPVKPVTEAPRVETAAPKVETKKAELDGSVEFQMGKLGLLDVSDPKMIGKNKAELAGKIQTEIPNFFNLSVEQQLYALKKLEQRTGRNINIDTERAVIDADKVNKKGGFIGRIGRNFSQGSRIAKLRKEKIAETKASGYEGMKADLKQLTGFVETRGIDVALNKNGGLSLQFISMERAGKNEKHEKLIEEFNDKASALSNIPYDWRVEHATVYQQKRFAMTQKSYEKAREKLMAYESKGADGEVKAEKNLEFLNTEAEIEMGQFLADNPGVEGAVNNFIKEHPILAKAGTVLMGSGARGFAKYGAAFGGGLGASALLGGFTSWTRKRGELREIEAQKRAGKDVGETKGVKETIDMAGYTKRMNALIEQAKKTSDPKSKQRLLQTLQTRMTILQDRVQNLGAAAFGTKEKDINTQFEYTRAVIEANGLLAKAEGMDEKVAQEVYEKFDKRYLKDDAKDAERRSEVRKAFKRGALIGAAGFAGSFIARDIYSHDGEALKSAWNTLQEESNKVFGSSGGPVMNEAAQDHFQDISAIKKETPDFQKLKINSEAQYKMPESIGTNRGSTGWHVETPTEVPIVPGMTFEQAVGARGAIGAIDDLQERVTAQYGDNIPEHLKAFMGMKPEKLAQEWGFYHPGEDAESAVILRGAKFEIDENGQILFESNDGQMVHLGGAEKFAGKFFDAGHHETVATGSGTSPSTEHLDQAVDNDIHESVAGDASIVHEDGASSVSIEEHGTNNVAEKAAETATEYSQVSPEGLTFNSPEIHGTLKVTYDDFGRVMKMDLGTTGSVEEVNQFLRTPDRFLMEDLKAAGLKFPTRSFGTGELSAIKPDCADYLKYRGFLRAGMQAGKFAPGSPEYKFLMGQMNLKAEAIHGRVGNIFRPLQEDRILSKPTLTVEHVAEKPIVETPKAQVEAPKPEMKVVPKEIPPTGEVAPAVKPVSEVLGLRPDDSGIRGNFQFLHDPKTNEIIKFQVGSTLRVPEANEAFHYKLLKANWENIGNHDTKIVHSDLKLLKIYEGVRETSVKQGLFQKGSDQYKYLTKMMETIIEKNKDILDPDKINTVEKEILKAAA